MRQLCVTTAFACSWVGIGCSPSLATSINKGITSACQEGNAIEVSNPPFDGTHPGTRKVTISYNYVAAFQKGGIVVSGDVDAKVSRNKAAGLGNFALIPQYGIQMGFGARGTITRNTVWDALAPDSTMAGGGILLVKPGDGVSVYKNYVNETDVGIWLAGANHATVTWNTIQYSTYSGVALDDREKAVTGNLVRWNHATNNYVGIGLFGIDTTSNFVKLNNAQDNTAAGICVEFAEDNILFRNWANRNPGDGITVDGEFTMT